MTSLAVILCLLGTYIMLQYKQDMTIHCIILRITYSELLTQMSGYLSSDQCNYWRPLLWITYCCPFVDFPELQVDTSKLHDSAETIEYLHVNYIVTY